jgi:hypothetical protein
MVDSLDVSVAVPQAPLIRFAGFWKNTASMAAMVVRSMVGAGFGDFLGFAAASRRWSSPARSVIQPPSLQPWSLGTAAVPKWPRPSRGGTLSYVPFTFFKLLIPLVSILYAFTGIRMLKEDTRPAEYRSGKGGNA